MPPAFMLAQMLLMVIPRYSAAGVAPLEASPDNLVQCMLRMTIDNLICLDLNKTRCDPCRLHNEVIERLFACIIRFDWVQKLDEQQNSELFGVIVKYLKNRQCPVKISRKKRWVVRYDSLLFDNWLQICMLSKSCMVPYWVDTWRQCVSMSLLQPDQIMTFYDRMNELAQTRDLSDEKEMHLYLMLAGFSTYTSSLRWCNAPVAIPWAMHKEMMRNLLTFGSDAQCLRWLHQKIRATSNLAQFLKDDEVRKVRRRVRHSKILCQSTKDNLEASLDLNGRDRRN